MPLSKSNEQIKTMAKGGAILAGVIRDLEKAVRPGITTKQLDDVAYKLITEAGCKPAFLHYKPYGAKKAYPATLCASINQTIVHGLPGDYVVQEGDLVKLDLGLIVDGLYVDSAVTVVVGEVPAHVQKLVTVTRDALHAGIKQARIGNTLGDIGAAIERVATTAGFHIAEGLTGHGIGHKLHEDPYVANVGVPGHGLELQEGMTLALEPMLAIGTSKIKQLADDSFVTADGSLSAHFEHTIAVTKAGPIVLTK